MTHRLSSWASALERFLAANQARAFAYGSWDCLQFVRGAIEAMTGRAMQQFIYRTEAGAARQALRYCGSRSLVLAAEKLFAAHGFARVAPAFAQRGDVVLIGGPRPAFGIVALHGKQAWSVTAPQGLVEVPLAALVGAWRV